MLKAFDGGEIKHNVPKENPVGELYACQQFVDDAHGTQMGKKEAIKAMEYLWKKCIYTMVKKEHWMNIISTKCVDTNEEICAYCEATASRPIFVAIPAEDWEHGDQDNAAWLDLSLVRHS